MREALVCILLEHQSKADHCDAVANVTVRDPVLESRVGNLGKCEIGPTIAAVAGAADCVSYGPAAVERHRTMTELLGEFAVLPIPAPQWDLIFWDIAEYTPEQLYSNVGAFIQVLALVRAVKADAATFREIFGEVMKRLEPLAASDEVRCARPDANGRASWAVKRRPPMERPELEAAAVTMYADVKRREEVRPMLEIEFVDAQTEFARRGFELGALESRRQDILELLTERFGAVPKELENQIETMSDLKRLKAAFGLALKVPSLAEFQL